MQFRTFASAIALCAGTAFGAMPALAATVNGVEIPADQLQVFVQHCETLQASENAVDQNESSDTTATTNNDNSSDSDETSAGIQGETGATNLVVDLDTVNLGVCQESGLLDGSAMSGDTTSGEAAGTTDAAATTETTAETSGTMGTLSEADRLIVTQHCETLAASENAVDANESSDTTATTNNDNSSDSDETSESNQGETGATSTTVDLDSYNLAACQEAGIIQ